MSTTSNHRSLTRTLIAAFVLATCIRVWLGPVTMTPQAHAQIPNAGQQRLEGLKEARKTNELLARIATILESGTLKVELDSTDKPVGNRTPTRGR